MLYDPARHEQLARSEWDEQAARSMIDRIVRDAEGLYSHHRSHWPTHPLDADGGSTQPLFNLYFGACGVAWALNYLQGVGAAKLRRSYREDIDALLPLNRAWLASQGFGDADAASFLMGDTGIEMLGHWLSPSSERTTRLEELIARNIEHPARELMWGAPGTLLCALFLHRLTGEARWAELYVLTARRLWSQLIWSPEHRCRYWSQELYGHRYTYLDGVHGFVATAAAIIGGRHLIDPREWSAWEECFVETIRVTAIREGGAANWPPLLYPPNGTGAQELLMQFCHGAPGFVIGLADLPSDALDDLLLAGGEAIWAAGPLKKGSNLCHGTGGNGYAFLKLHERTGDRRWLARARAFAMHGIAQTSADARRYGQMRCSLWTGDLGFAIFLADCIRGAGRFPTLETFFA